LTLPQTINKDGAPRKNQPNFCSDGCRVTGWKRKERRARLEKQEEDGRYVRLRCVADSAKCLWCKKTMTIRLPWQNRKTQLISKYCSKACYRAQWFINKNPKAPPPIPKDADARDRIGIAKRKCVSCGDEYMPVNNNGTMEVRNGAPKGGGWVVVKM